MLFLSRNKARVISAAGHIFSTQKAGPYFLHICTLAAIVLSFGCGKDRCTPGTTLECICPGAKGAQVCKTDGSGYGKCECASPVRAPASNGEGKQAAAKAEAKPVAARVAAATEQPAVVAAAADSVDKATEAATVTASKAYRQVIQAFNAYEPDRYFGGFADPFCFYAAEKDGTAFRRSRGKLFRDKKMRLTTAIKVLRANTQEVLLWDSGTWGTSGNAPKPHNKLILMRYVAGAWLVAVEASLKRHQCAPTLLAGVPQSLLAEVEDATKVGAKVRVNLAQMEAKKILCMREADRLGRGSGKSNDVICIVETSARSPGKDELHERVAGYVTVQEGTSVKRVMRFDSRSEEGSAGRSDVGYFDDKRGHFLKIAFCSPCEPPTYEDLEIRAGSFKLDVGMVEVTKGPKDGGF